MNRVLRVLWILLLFELGVLVAILPWSAAWEHNYFIERYPDLIPYLLNPFLRGALSGLGVLDIGIAASLIGRRGPATAATRS